MAECPEACELVHLAMPDWPHESCLAACSEKKLGGCDRAQTWAGDLKVLLTEAMERLHVGTVYPAA